MVAPAYHRLLRTKANYRWWRPLAVAAVAGAIYALLLLIYWWAVDELAWQSLSDLDYSIFWVQAYEETSAVVDPFALVLLLGGVALMLPCLMIARAILREGGLGALSSVAGKIRWQWLTITMVPALGYGAAQAVLSFGVLGSNGQTDDAVASLAPFISVVVILLLVPFQAAAEEYIFRGFLLQAIGSWVRFAPLVVLLVAIPFVLGHGYEPWGMVEVLYFAIVAATLTIRTGGIEAAISLHIMTNLPAFIGPVFGFSLPAGLPGLAVTIVLLTVYGTVVDGLFRRARNRSRSWTSFAQNVEGA